MKKVWIANITINNPHITSYVKRIKSWDEKENFQLKDDSFYAIYLDDEFLAASTMDYNSENSNVNILLINGSNQNYDRIQQESTELLTDIALKQYGAVKSIKVNSQRQLIRK